LKADGSAPVVIFNDGDSYLNLMTANVILDNLVADHTIPPMIALFVENVPNGREKFLNCTPEWNELLARELMDEVVGKEKAASRDALRHVVVGYSLGGLAAGCAAKAHPEVFGAVIAQSGSFFRAPEGEPPEWLARQIATTPSVQQKWYVEIGRLESAPIPNRDPSMLTASRHLRDVLNAKGYPVFYVEHFNGHEHIAWRATLGDALKRVLGGE
jgi:enterochelin esterase-like enzyme